MWWQLTLLIFLACCVFPPLLVWLVKTVEALSEDHRHCPSQFPPR